MSLSLPMHGPERTILDEFLGVLLRRKAVILLTTLGMVVAVYFGLWVLPEKYEATAQLQVMLGRENTQVPADAQRGAVYAPGVQREEINSDIQLLKSPELIEQVMDTVGPDVFKFEPPPPHTLVQRLKAIVRSVKRWVTDSASSALVSLGLEKELTDREKVIELLTGALTVTREGESNVILVATRLPSRDVALQTVSTLVQLFLDRYASLRATAKVVPLLEKQVTGDTVDLAQLENERQQVLREWGISSVERQRQELLQRLHKVLYEADARQTELAAAEARLAALTERATAAPALERERQTTQPNPAVDTLKQRLADLRVKRTDIASRYLAESSQMVRQMDAEIATVEQMLAREAARQRGDETSQASPLRQLLQSQIEQTTVQVAGLRAAMPQDADHATALKEELSRLGQGESRLAMVDLRYDAAQKRYVADVTRLNSARIDETFDQHTLVNVAVLAAASAPPEPVSPQKLRIMEFSVAGGLILGIVLGMILEWRDDTIHGREEVARATQLPYLGEFRLGESVASLSRISTLAGSGPAPSPLSQRPG